MQTSFGGPEIIVFALLGLVLRIGGLVVWILTPPRPKPPA